MCKLATNLFVFLLTLSLISCGGSDIKSFGMDSDPDELLDAYEEFIDDYLKFLRKVTKGDLSAISEAEPLEEKAEKIAGFLEDMDDDDKLNASQASRYLKLTTKFSEGAMKIMESMQ